MDNAFEQAIDCLPPPLRQQVHRLSKPDSIEELRFRAGKPPQVRRQGTERDSGLPLTTTETLREIVARATRYSVHSYAGSLQAGFVTLSGGHRLGVCGTMIRTPQGIGGVQTVASLNLRIARQFDCGGEIPLTENGRPCATLVLSPPGFGKTTLLRALVRRLSDAGVTVGVVDERSELAALQDGVPQFALGAHTDVIENCDKLAGALLLLKTMSPRALVLDEITAPTDARAVLECAHCGVAVLASAHAAGMEELCRRRCYRRLLDEHVFRQIVLIQMRQGIRSYEIQAGRKSEC